MVITQMAKTTADLGGAFSPERIKYSLEMTALGLIAVFAIIAITSCRRCFGVYADRGVLLAPIRKERVFLAQLDDEGKV